jgi:hypothetical protein
LRDTVRQVADWPKETDRQALKQRRQTGSRLADIPQETNRQWTGRQAAGDRETSRRQAAGDRHVADWKTALGR